MRLNGSLSSKTQVYERKIHNVQNIMSLGFIKIFRKIYNMTKTPEWGIRHTKVARRLEEHLKAEKPKVYTSYSKYMKVLHAKTS